jgi:hypothetical protein
LVNNDGSTKKYVCFDITRKCSKPTLYTKKILIELNIVYVTLKEDSSQEIVSFYKILSLSRVLR